MNESILTSVKKLLGITEEYESFDADLIIHINTVFSILQQIGVGPDRGFSINDKSATWDDFVNDSRTLADIRSYMYMKVRLMFDPPTSSPLLDNMKQLISELEWRLSVAADIGKEY